MSNIFASMRQGAAFSQDIHDNAFQARQRNALAALGPAAASGNQNALTQLYAVAPDVASGIQQNAFARKEFDAAQAQTEEKNRLEGARKLARMVLSAEDPASAYPRVRAMAEAQGFDVSSLPPTYDEDAEIAVRLYAMDDAEQTEIERLIGRLGTPEERRRAILVATGLEAKAGTLDPSLAAAERAMPGTLARAGMVKGGLAADAGEMLASQDRGLARDQAAEQFLAGHELDQSRFAETQRANRAREETARVRATRPETVVNVGGTTVNNIPLGKKAFNEVQSGAVKQLDLLGRLDALYGDFDPRALTYLGQAEGFLTKRVEKLDFDPGDESRANLQNLTQFRIGVEQLFNAYRQEITGAAAAVQELERLKKSFINADMSKTEFQSAYAQFRAELARGLRLKEALMTQGIRPGSPDFGEQFDQLYLSGADADSRPANQIPPGPTKRLRYNPETGEIE